MRHGIGWALVTAAIAGCAGTPAPTARETVTRPSFAPAVQAPSPSPGLAGSPGTRATTGPLILGGGSSAPASAPPGGAIPASPTPRPRASVDLTATDVVLTIAGTGEEGDADGDGLTQATFGSPQGVAVDGKNRVYVSDYTHNRLRLVGADGLVSTIAGVGPGSADGAGEHARFNNPAGLAVNPAGTRVVVADYYNFRLRTATLVEEAWTIGTLAGSSAGGLKDGAGALAQFSYPAAVALAEDGTAYVADTSNDCLRKVTPAGVVTTVIASGLSRPAGVALSPDGELWVADSGHHRLCKLTNLAASPKLVVVSGGPDRGEVDGTPVQARFSNPRGLAFDEDGTLYVADTDNHRVRKLTFAEDGRVTVSTAAGDGHAGHVDGPRSHARFDHPYAVAVDAKHRVYVADSDNRVIRRIQ